jgi:hypothetical protein
VSPGACGASDLAAAALLTAATSSQQCGAPGLGNHNKQQRDSGSIMCFSNSCWNASTTARAHQLSITTIVAAARKP